jgi:uncharacterized protein with von Willebrand factor type A (vWA) domain
MGLDQMQKLLHVGGSNDQNQETTPRMGEKSLPAIHQIKNIQNFKGLEKLNTKRTDVPIDKWANELNKRFSKEEVYRKKCLASFMKEMQIKPTLRI